MVVQIRPRQTHGNTLLSKKIETAQIALRKEI